MALKNQSEEITGIIMALHIEAHGPSGALHAGTEGFEPADARNFMAVMEAMPIPKKLALIEWLQRSIQA